MRKLLSLLLVCILCCSLAACAGNSASTGATTSTDNSTEGSAVPETPSNEDTSNKEEVPQSGIVAMIAREDHTLDIVNIDITTGKLQTISSFSEEEALAKGGIKYQINFFENYGDSPLYATCKNFFSSDYSKMVVGLGWIDTEGNYFSVAEALDLLPKNEFEKAEYNYLPVGFTDDEQFTFYIWPSTSHYANDMVYYSVPVNDVRPETMKEMTSDYSKEMKYILSKPDKLRDYIITDWLDDTHFLADYTIVKSGQISRHNVLVDSTTLEISEYISGDVRHVWSSIYSPDKSQLAFISAPQSQEKGEKSEIYILNLSDNSTKRLSTDLPNSCKEMSSSLIWNTDLAEYDKGTFCTLLEWN